MKILITGANGQLGWHLQRVFGDHQLYLGDTANFDITQPQLVADEMSRFQPDLVIHGAAYTNVDGAEANRQLCRAINVDGSRHVALAAAAVGAPIIAISTDYVFHGDATSPYQESDSTDPLSFYGQTKRDGELAIIAANPKHYICRTSWLYGGPGPTPETDFSALPYKNFVYTMLRVGRERAEVEVVSDQVGGPTYCQDLALTLNNLWPTQRFGTYHITNSGVTSWADFAAAIFELAGYSTKVKPITSTEWAAKNPTATSRPAYSVLGHQAILSAGLSDLRPWREALAEFLAAYQEDRR